MIIVKMDKLKIQNNDLVCALAQLIMKLQNDWYYDSTCDGTGVHYNHEISTNKYILTYEYDENNFDSGEYKGVVTITLFTQYDKRKLNKALNIIENAINRDLSFLRKYYNPSSHYTYNVFGGEKDWKNAFKMINTYKLSVNVLQYNFDDVESMDYYPYHLKLVGGEFEENVRKKLLEELYEFQGIDYLEEGIKIYSGEFIYYDYRNYQEEDNITEVVVNFDEIFSKELDIYYNYKKLYKKNPIYYDI
jgi:hypothetical protein